MRRLQGKTALVTGGAKRIGRELVLALAAAGVNVVIHYNTSEQEACELATEVVRRGVSAWALRCDLSDPSGIERFMAQAIDQAKVLHFLVNGASYFAKSEFSRLQYDEFMAALRLEAWAPFALARAFASSQ